MNCIVNVDKNWGIGRENSLLVSISDDLKRFRSLTVGKTVVLGRKTLATFPGGRPLKNRRNIILSSDRSLYIDGAEIVHSLDDAFSLLKTIPREEVCIIGGASVYDAFVPYCSNCQLTRTFIDGGADRFFPDLSQDPNWFIVNKSDVLEENGIQYQYIDYQNKNPRLF